jgi:hypothetical protein
MHERAENGGYMGCCRVRGAGVEVIPGNGGLRGKEAVQRRIAIRTEETSARE